MSNATLVFHQCSQRNSGNNNVALIVFLGWLLYWDFKLQLQYVLQPWQANAQSVLTVMCL